MRRPSFQFYPDDWSANSNLKRCSHEEKGIWIDVMCVLHDQDEYGIVRWPLSELAQAVGTTKAKLKRLVEKGVLKGADDAQALQSLVYVPRSGRRDGDPVTLIEAQEGALWYSSRMVLDEYKRRVRGGMEAAPKDSPNLSPKGGIGEGIDDTPKPAPKDSPNLSPSTRAHGQAPRAAPSSPSSSSLKEITTLSGYPDASPPDSRRDNKKTAMEVLGYLNSKTGRSYRSVPANLDLIAARLNDGVGVEDCKAVIDAKTLQWGGDEKMREYLRPGTLFSRTKFEQYLGQLQDHQSPGSEPWDLAI